jgi:hypothetical protein
VANSVVVEFVGFSSDVDTVFGESVVDFGELAPVSGLPSSGQVFIRHNADVYLFDWVLELVHEYVIVALVDGELLIFVNADEGESNALNVKIVNHGVSEQVVGVQKHGLNGWVVNSAVCVDGEVLVLVPGVANDETAGQVVSAVSIEDEVGAWNVSVCYLHNRVNSRSSEQDVAGLFKLNYNVSLTKRNCC